MATIEIQGVSKAYTLNGKSQVLALKDINLSVRDGEFVAVIGPSGCGKSTLLHLVAALDRTSTGQILVNGEAPEVLRSEHRIGIAFQDHSLLPWLSIKANLALPFRIAGIRLDEARISYLFELVGLNGFEQARPKQLSGGMRQRAAIARALCLDPLLLLLDEPFGALDAVTRKRMNLELQRIWFTKKLTTLMVTHSVEEALFLADRIIVLSGRPGVIVQLLDVPFPHPRTLDCMRTEEFHQMIDYLTALLEP
jgi:NitT/TauT family transport system ATP-binding protein